MIYHPILNQLANIDLALLVRPSDEQRVEGQTACFCPFCEKDEAAADGRSARTPHFIIYNNERGGLYDGVGVEGDSLAQHGAVKWMCTKTGKKGYGAIELYAAVHHLLMHGQS